MGQELLGRSRWTVIGIIWAASICWGMWALASYNLVPGQTVDAFARRNYAEHDPAGKWQLNVFAHPQCPCTRAALAELERIAAHCGERMSIVVYFVKPEGAPEDWLDSFQVHAARGMRGVRTEVDEGGRLAARFGAKASGCVFLVSPSGQVAFQGGITSSRGMEGESLGQSAIVDLVHGKKPDVHVAPVFGCSLGVE